MSDPRLKIGDRLTFGGYYRPRNYRLLRLLRRFGLFRRGVRMGHPLFFTRELQVFVVQAIHTSGADLKPADGGWYPVSIHG